MVSYVAQILVFVSVFVILASSLNLVMGYGGVISVVHAAFFGIGAYTTARLAVIAGVPFPLDLVASFAVAALIALAIGLPIIRLSEEYIIVGTLALQLIVSNVFLNWEAVTGGSYGIFGIPRPSIGGFELTSLVSFSIFSVAIAAACFLVLWLVARSPFGLALKGLREDDILAQSFGKHVSRQRATVFALGSGVAGIAGMLYARYVGFIEPSSFNVGQSLSIITITVVGGLGNLWGTVISAGILETVPQTLRFIPATSRAVPHLQLLFFGLLLIVLVRWRPQGIIGERSLVRAPDDRAAEPRAENGPASPNPSALGGSEFPPLAHRAHRLEVRQISKTFGGLRAVDNLSFGVESGRITAIIGPNGAGKTTVFNMLTGYLKPDYGSISYGEHELTRMRPFEISRLGIARSFQDVRVFSRMTVLENMVFATQDPKSERLGHVLSPLGWTGRRQEQARDHALQRLEGFDLLQRANTRVANLSYAEQKILVVAMLAARRAPLILLDELAAGLDHESVAAFSRLTRQMAAAGHTICLIEHNLDFVWQTADRVLVFDQGRLIAAGTPKEIRRNQEVAEIYFGSTR